MNFKFISFKIKSNPAIVLIDINQTSTLNVILFTFFLSLLQHTYTAESTESGDRRHDRDHSSTTAPHPVGQGLDQASKNKKPYHNNGASDSDLISEPAMDEVEADEIISAAEGFGDSARRDSTHHTDKQQVQGKRTTTAAAAQQSTVRMLSKKLLLVNLLANFLMFAIAGFITYHCFYKATVLFSWHPTFMSIGVSISETSVVVCDGGFV